MVCLSRLVSSRACFSPTVSRIPFKVSAATGFQSPFGSPPGVGEFLGPGQRDLGPRQFRGWRRAAACVLSVANAATVAAMHRGSARSSGDGAAAIYPFQQGAQRATASIALTQSLFERSGASSCEPGLRFGFQSEPIRFWRSMSPSEPRRCRNAVRWSLTPSDTRHPPSRWSRRRRPTDRRRGRSRGRRCLPRCRRAPAACGR